jgi:hypothetical protein
VEGFPDRFKAEELLKVVGEPQNKIMRVEKFVISKLIKPVIQNNKVYYDVKWKNHKDTTLEPRQNLLKDVPKMLSQFKKKNDINIFMIAGIQRRMRLQDDIIMVMSKEIYSIDNFVYVCL